MENQPIARLTFTCNRNWEEMAPVAGGRFCNDCQKKVVDFTDKTNDEIAAYLMSSTTKVCGRFQQSQLITTSQKPVWKRWLSAAAMFAAVYMGIKEASAQQLAPAKESKNISFSGTNPEESTVGFASIDKNPQFPGGEKAFSNYLIKDLNKHAKNKGEVIELAFVIEKDGTLTNPEIRKGINKNLDQKILVKLKNCPAWTPGIKEGKAIRKTFLIPIEVK